MHGRNHQIVNFLTFDQPFTSTYYTLRVDIISEDHKVIDNDSFLIQCCHGYIDTAVYIHAQGYPFLFKVIKDEKFSETKKRILTLLKCDNEILRLKNIINELTIQNEKILNENRDLKEKNNVLEIDKKQQQRKIAVMENEIEQLKNENMILKINNDKYLKQISNNESQINAFNQEPNKRFIRMSSSEAFIH